MDKQLLEQHLLAAYREIVPDPSVNGDFLIQRLAASLYERGARIVIGGTITVLERVLHQSLDPDQRIVWTDKEWNRTLGFRSHAIVGHHVSEFLTADSYDFFQQIAWPQLLKDGKIGPVAITMVAYSGELIPAMARSEILKNEHGDFERTFTKLRAQITRAA